MKKYEDSSAPLLSAVMPKFYLEFSELLTVLGDVKLLGQLKGIHVVDRCDCGDRECATFFTQPKPLGAWGEGHRNVVLSTIEYDLVLDLLNEQIACVEILGRADLKLQLDTGYRPCRK